MKSLNSTIQESFDQDNSNALILLQIAKDATAKHSYISNDALVTFNKLVTKNNIVLLHGGKTLAIKYLNAVQILHRAIQHYCSNLQYWDEYLSYNGSKMWQFGILKSKPNSATIDDFVTGLLIAFTFKTKCSVDYELAKIELKEKGKYHSNHIRIIINALEKSGAPKK